MKVIEVVTARGHRNMLVTNEQTFEITKDLRVTEKGDCIVAVAADKSGPDLSKEFKKALQCEKANLTIIFKVGDEKEVIQTWGNPNLSLSHPTDLVIRKSSFICGRTLGIKASKAARDFSRSLVKKLIGSQMVRI
ncbi:DUF371 domain-containing protein, partial [Candidatus Bathyarchaeota archaeon]|nr:DUF371 domain-containing protein [Candidatus Bathyarchaeota archaeon]